MRFFPRIFPAGLAFTGILALLQTDLVAANHEKGCPPFKRSFEIDYFQVYPENADFDFQSCLLYIGFVFFFKIYSTGKKTRLTLLAASGMPPLAFTTRISTKWWMF
jgi:hypothetical protein